MENTSTTSPGMGTLQGIFLVLVAIMAPFIVFAAWKQGPELPVVQNDTQMEYSDLGFHKFAYNLVESAKPRGEVIVENMVEPGSRNDTGSVFTENSSDSRSIASANSYRIDTRSDRVISRDSALYDQYQGELIKEGNRRYGSSYDYPNNSRYTNTASVANTGVQIRNIWVIFILVMIAVIVMLTRINYRKRARVAHRLRH